MNHPSLAGSMMQWASQSKCVFIMMENKHIILYIDIIENVIGVLKEGVWGSSSFSHRNGKNDFCLICNWISSTTNYLLVSMAERVAASAVFPLDAVGRARALIGPPPRSYPHEV